MIQHVGCWISLEGKVILPSRPDQTLQDYFPDYRSLEPLDARMLSEVKDQAEIGPIIFLCEPAFNCSWAADCGRVIWQQDMI